MTRILAVIVILAGLSLTVWNNFSLPIAGNWTDTELAFIHSLKLSELAKLLPDPGNQYADSEAAAELGHSLFFDTRLSSNGAVSCASCHKPELFFTDGLERAVGVGIGPRHTPSLVGLSYSPWFYWDGRKDSQWAQALAPLESAHEHNISRLEVVQLLFTDPDYAKRYTEMFGAIPQLPTQAEAASPLGNEAARARWALLTNAQQQTINNAFANAGKSLAAYQRKLIPGAARFDEYANSLDNSTAIVSNEHLSAQELAGLRVFIGKGQCASCHNGPLFTNHEFHNTGVLSLQDRLPPMGRYDGIRISRDDPFNCLGEYSDAEASQCIELRFARDTNDLVGAHKTPTLRNSVETAPYMHAGQIQTLREVIEHYNEAPTSMLSHNEAKPLGLRPVEIRQLEAFLHSLSAPLKTDIKWLTSPEGLQQN